MFGSAANLTQKLIDAASGPANDVARSELRRTIALNRDIMDPSRTPNLKGYKRMNLRVANALLDLGDSTSLDGNLTMLGRLQSHLWASVMKPGYIYTEAQRSVAVADHMAEGGGNRRTTANNGGNMVENMRRSSAYTRKREPVIRADMTRSHPNTLEGLQPTKSSYIQMNGTGYGYSAPRYSLDHLPADEFQSAPPPQHHARAQFRDSTRKVFPSR